MSDRNQRRRGGLRPVSETVPRITRHLTSRRGFADGGLLLDWQKIVGQDIARRSRPVKLTFEDRATRRAGTLLLHTAPGFALDLQHLAPLLIERINGYYGYEAVAKLTFKQGPLRPKTQSLRPAAPALAPAVAQALDHRLETVEDPDLRTALARFGQSFYGRAARAGGSRNGGSRNGG